MSTCARWESSSIVLRIKGPYFILTFNSIYVKVLHEFYPTQQKWYCKWANGLPADDIPTILPSVSLPTIALPGVMQNCGQCLPSSGIITTVQRLLLTTMPWLYFHVLDCNQTAQLGIHQQCFTRVVNDTSELSSEKLQNSKLFRLFLVLLKHPLLKSRDVKAEFIRLMLLKRDYKLILIWKQNSLDIRKYVNSDSIKINQSKPE